MAAARRGPCRARRKLSPEYFIVPNRRFWPGDELASRLDDHLYRLRGLRGEDAYPRSARQYLDDWASEERAWFRKIYPATSDDPHYDLTPSAERAISWLEGLERRQFVGTASRLMTVFELLRQLLKIPRLIQRPALWSLRNARRRSKPKFSKSRTAGCP